MSLNEKSNAALSSVGAAVFLTSLKIVVGIYTGSLGILAEAAHSGLDFMAAVVTFIAVRAASRPQTKVMPMAMGKLRTSPR